MVNETAHARARAALLVAAAAPAGVLLRIAVAERFRADGGGSMGGAVPLSLAPNIFGSVLLGVLDTASAHVPPCLRVGLATGFCASLTTFASAIFHSSHLYIHGAVGRGITSLILTVLVPPAAYVLACDVVTLLMPSDLHEPQWPMRQWVSTAICLMAFAIMSSALITAVVLFRDVVWRAALFSPFGALLRYAFQLKLNSGSDEFWYRVLPCGTLVANLLACVLDSSLATLDYKGIRADGWLLAARVGFVGSLSTVSAFAAELVRLPRSSRVLYGLVSVTVAVLIAVIIHGSVVWSSTN